MEKRERKLEGILKRGETEIRKILGELTDLERERFLIDLPKVVGTTIVNLILKGEQESKNN